VALKCKRLGCAIRSAENGGVSRAAREISHEGAPDSGVCFRKPKSNVSYKVE